LKEQRGQLRASEIPQGLKPGLHFGTLRHD